MLFPQAEDGIWNPESRQNLYGSITSPKSSRIILANIEDDYKDRMPLLMTFG